MSKKLLLADDSVTIQKVVNLTFADEGIDVITVGDGDTAIKLVTELKPDIVIADVHMPGLNGYQVCEKIKTTEELKKIPVILLVGTFEPFDEEEAKRVGADDFLMKPFQSIRLLISKVSELLEPTFTDGQIQSQEGEAEELDPEVGSMVTVADDETIKEESPSDFIHTKANYQEKSERELAITTPLSADDIKEIEKEQLSSIEDREDEPLSDQQIEAQTASETQLNDSPAQETHLQELQQDLVSPAQEFQTEEPQSKTAVEFEKTYESEPERET
ncbi:MAG: response regulator, partial [Acidobacteria bacterium]